MHCEYSHLTHRLAHQISHWICSTRCQWPTDKFNWFKANHHWLSNDLTYRTASVKQCYKYNSFQVPRGHNIIIIHQTTTQSTTIPIIPMSLTHLPVNDIEAAMNYGGSKGGSKSGRKGGSKGGRKGGSKGGSKGGRKGGSKHRGRHRPNYQSRQPDAEWSGDEEMSMLQLKKAAACLSLNHSCISKFWMSMTGLIISAGFIWSWTVIVWFEIHCGTAAVWCKVQRGGGQALGGNWPSRTILIAWGADAGEPAHPIDVINDVDEEVIFHNLVFWKLELHLVSIDDVKCLLKMSDSIACCCCCCKSLCLALTQLLNFIHSVHKIALFMSDNDTSY